MGRVIRRNEGNIRRKGEVIRTSVDTYVHGRVFEFKSYGKAYGLNFIRTLLWDIRKCPSFIR